MYEAGGTVTRDALQTQVTVNAVSLPLSCNCKIAVCCYHALKGPAAAGSRELRQGFASALHGVGSITP